MFSKSRLLAKFCISRCKLHNTKPSLEVFKAKLKATLKKWYAGKPLRKVGIFYSLISVSNSLFYHSIISIFE